MSEVITNMKVRFGADTKQFNKGMDDGKKAVQTFKTPDQRSNNSQINLVCRWGHWPGC